MVADCHRTGHAKQLDGTREREEDCENDRDGHGYRGIHQHRIFKKPARGMSPYSACLEAVADVVNSAGLFRSPHRAEPAVRS